MTADPLVRGPHNTPCQHCGRLHGNLCPAVAALEYHPDGSLKRVEFRDEFASRIRLEPARADCPPGGLAWVRGEAGKVRELSWLHDRWVWAWVVRDANGLILTREYEHEAN